jgi:hypothetical protein
MIRVRVKSHLTIDKIRSNNGGQATFKCLSA